MVPIITTKIFQQHYYLALAVIILLLNGCTVIGTSQKPTIENESESASSTSKSTPKKTASVPVAPKTSTPTQHNPAVIALLRNAQQQQQQGDLGSAQTSVQRAQRIAPHDPEIYYELANIHRELNDYALAEQVAFKGLSLVQGQMTQLHRFWRLIAIIRTEAGDSQGAKKAQNMANHY